MKSSVAWFAVLVALTTVLGILAPDPASADRRLALVVGNSRYQFTPALANPLHDARDMAAALERTGFEVIVATDADKRQMDGALRAFAEKVGSADVALFFYAGHGLQVGNENYLVPVDARLATQRDLEFEAVKLDFVLRQMEIDREGKTTIVMLDACRDNPLTRSLARSMGTRSTAIGRGLAPAATGVGTFIAYATQPGNVALDGKGRNSPFTSALLANVPKKGRNLNATMIEVRRAVIKATGGRQVPWDHSALTGDFYFVPGDVASGSQSRAPAGKADDVEALKARLKALEEAEQQRRASIDEGEISGGKGAEGGGVSLEVISRIAEARARLVVAEDKVKDLTNRLFASRRAWGQSKDREEMQRLQREGMQLQLDMTRASMTAKQLREEIARLSSPSPETRSPGGRAFDVRDGMRAVGVILPAGTGKEACERRCEDESKCVSYNQSRSGACELLASVEREVRASEWKTGLRPCDTIGLGWDASIPLNVGRKLCNGIGLFPAEVKRVERGSVTFAADGREFVCRADTICRMRWNGAPEFRVQISGSGDAISAEMLPIRR